MMRPSSARGDQGSVGLVIRKRPVNWVIKSTRYHGTNVVSCKIVTGLNWTLFVGAYLPSSTLEHLPELEEALQRSKDPIFLGCFNVDLDKARIPRSQQVADILA